MVRLFPATGCQFQVNFLIWACLTCLTAASLSIEERLQTLEKTNVEIKQILAAKSEHIEALENEVQQLKSTVFELTEKIEASNKERKKRENKYIADSNQPTTKNAILRTCQHETHMADPSLPSGLYWIDPDGQGVGEDPIQVYCNMTNGTTSIPHDNESPTNVGHCSNPGCYSKIINYSATKRQMAALVELSNECHQSFRYDCNFAPFETNGVAYSWWNDRNGNPQYFWAGSNSSVHTCQCGINQSCIESTMKCNCDSSIPVPEFDNGIITNKNLLPVTRLNFGRTWLKVSSGVYTLGRFECSGKVAINGMPSSCADLWKIGHTLNGLYSIMGHTEIESVYCNFTKLYSETGFQNHLGYVDVKSLPVYFYVQRNNSFHTLNTPIPFELERVNIGGAMNLTTGIFTAPRPGVYFFAFSGLSNFPLHAVSSLGICLMLNNNVIGTSWADSKTGTGGYHETLSLQSILNMKAGDKVWLQITGMKNSNLHDSSGRYTDFIGQLLQDFSHSPNSSRFGSN